MSSTWAIPILRNLRTLSKDRSFHLSLRYRWINLLLEHCNDNHQKRFPILHVSLPDFRRVSIYHELLFLSYTNTSRCCSIWVDQPPTKLSLSRKCNSHSLRSWPSPTLPSPDLGHKSQVVGKSSSELFFLTVDSSFTK